MKKATTKLQQLRQNISDSLNHRNNLNAEIKAKVEQIHGTLEDIHSEQNSIYIIKQNTQKEKEELRSLKDNNLKAVYKVEKAQINLEQQEQRLRVYHCNLLKNERRQAELQEKVAKIKALIQNQIVADDESISDNMNLSAHGTDPKNKKEEKQQHDRVNSLIAEESRARSELLQLEDRLYKARRANSVLQSHIENIIIVDDSDANLNIPNVNFDGRIANSRNNADVENSSLQDKQNNASNSNKSSVGKQKPNSQYFSLDQAKQYCACLQKRSQQLEAGIRAERDCLDLIEAGAGSLASVDRETEHIRKQSLLFARSLKTQQSACNAINNYII